VNSNQSVLLIFISYNDVNMYMEKFFSEYFPLLRQSVVLVSHNGDASAPVSDVALRLAQPDWPNYDYCKYLEDDKILLWYASNCYWDSRCSSYAIAKIKCVPIGIENRYINNNVMRYYDQHKKCRDIARVPGSVLLAFTENPYKPDRAVAIAALGSKSFVTVRHFGSWGEWADAVCASEFVICPLGHGLDTHRLWEVLLLGAYPVVRTSTLDLLYYNLPVVVVKTWVDVTVALLHSASQRLQHVPCRDSVYVDYWYHQLRYYVKPCSIPLISSDCKKDVAGV